MVTLERMEGSSAFVNIVAAPITYYYSSNGPVRIWSCSWNPPRPSQQVWILCLPVTCWRVGPPNFFAGLSCSCTGRSVPLLSLRTKGGIPCNIMSRCSQQSSARTGCGQDECRVGATTSRSGGGGGRIGGWSTATTPCTTGKPCTCCFAAWVPYNTGVHPVGRAPSTTPRAAARLPSLRRRPGQETSPARVEKEGCRCNIVHKDMAVPVSTVGAPRTTDGGEAWGDGTA